MRQRDKKGTEGHTTVSTHIQGECNALASMNRRGELGKAIARLILAYSPRDLQQMRGNFSRKIQDFSPPYQKTLEEAITGYLQGTYQRALLMNQQGVFSTMDDAVQGNNQGYWNMVAASCASGNAEEDRLRFLKYLLSAFCMFVQGLPGHPAGMLFPGGERVECVDGVYYCPVRTKANDVDSAFCPFCPALQTPGPEYLKPPVNAGEHRRQEYLRHCFDRHHFNG